MRKLGRQSFLLRTAVAVALAVGFAGLSAHPQALPSVSPLTLNHLASGPAPLDGEWQFHLGDNPAWATPNVDDATGHDGWQSITADAPWGEQGHRSYSGYAWYRKHIHFGIAGAPLHQGKRISKHLQ